jgi:hypothetical protein
VKERLDRVVATSGWREKFPDVDVEVLAARSSDHAPLCVSFSHTNKRHRGRMTGFRYEPGWHKNLVAREVIKQVWRVKENSNDAWKNVRNRLAKSRSALLQWRKVNVSPTEDVIKSKTVELQTLQGIDGPLDLVAIREVQRDVNNALEQDDLKWRLRAKEHWLKSGDKNTKFFHACATQKKRRNTITSICDVNGAVCTTNEGIEEAFVSYFTHLFASSAPTGVEECLQNLPRKVTMEMNEMLTREFAVEEISTAMLQMAPMKSPGPDGFPTSFYQDNWEVLQEEVCAAFASFFSSGSFDSSVNKTHIALIPKIQNPTKVTEFRPISLCNVLYKIMSKVLANRLKIVLPSIISKNQSAFIPGRLISDNILVAFEALHTMHSRMWGKVGYMALKLDMSKAYDRVEWRFLEVVMEKLGFDLKWIRWIMQCITTVQYSVVVNGIPVGEISPSRGIRQGDPISPYLFILCAEVLSSHLQYADHIKMLSGVPTSPKGPRLNHLFFADDSLIFCKAQPEDWNILIAILSSYERASGQMLNRDKTSIFFSRNTTQAAKECILQLSGIPATQRYDRYLGLPSLVGRSRVREFQNIMDRVRQKIFDWKTKFLSLAGKEVMIKAVLQAIPTYSMSIFLLPKELCKELNSLMQKFWWGHKENDKKIMWMSWERMGTPKSNGGMGFRDLVSFNKALLAKQCWRLVQDPNSLAGSIIKAKYFPKGTLMEAKLGSRPSYAWRSLLAARELFMDGMVWRIGNGASVHIWGDKWISGSLSHMVQSPCRVLAEDAKVGELVDGSTCGWNSALVHEIFHEQEAALICNIPLSRYSQPDRIIWSPTTSGDFSVKSAYHLDMESKAKAKGECSRPGQGNVVWQYLWNMQVPNSTKVFLWRACKGILPTKDNLKRRKVVQDDLCLICHTEEETVAHILWECPSSKDVWGVCRRSLQKCGVMGVDFFDVFETITLRCKREDALLFGVVAKQIWARRNEVLHGGISYILLDLFMTLRSLCNSFN